MLQYTGVPVPMIVTSDPSSTSMALPNAKS
jgi:hypothetical protein